MESKKANSPLPCVRVGDGGWVNDHENIESKSKKNSKKANFIESDSIESNVANSNAEKKYTYFYKDSKKSYDLCNLDSYKVLPPILKHIKEKIQNLDSKDSKNIESKHTKNSKNPNNRHIECSEISTKNSKNHNFIESKTKLDSIKNSKNPNFIESKLDSKHTSSPTTTKDSIESKLDFLTLATMFRQMYPNLPQELQDLPLPFGGLGYVAYEFFSECENITFSKNALYDAPEAILAFPKECIIFDHFFDEAYIVVSAFKGGEFDTQKRLQNIESKMQKVRNIKTIESKKLESKILYEDSKEWYKKYVKVIKNEIYKGTFLQCVLSRAMSIQSNLNPLSFYEKLRRNNPSPYMYFLDFGDFKIIGASPEVMLKCKNGVQTLRPIAGTRRRGATLSEDNALANELLNDEKESAEHLMLVDLGRNDIGRSASPGSVKIDAFRVIERYSSVMHIVSQVSGEIAADKNVNDCFKACFPAGTISGAPKIEAISKLELYETHARGIYSGAILYFTRNGDLDSAITLRSCVYKGIHSQNAENLGIYYLQAGAGIVIDSNEEAEYLETCKKMQALREILIDIKG
ncbi:anthranilate synthase component I family protein [Helicobacter saguini]|nr:anthranilate synthase component I family protein [Helicobacter saguini]MWV69016.1 anthranilate synthase component I family protein [Helicobacter saguini]